MKKGIFWFMVIVLLIIGSLYIAYKTTLNKDNQLWKVEIVNTYINVRDNNNLAATKIKSVKKGQEFNVISTYLEDSYYVWYEIEVDAYTKGWISSERNNPYVKEINNPNQIDEKSYFIDYICPVIKYFDEIYYVSDIESISYDHLTIEDTSEYEITSTIYFDEFPKDRAESQYFIKYKVVDSFGNVSSKIQKIEFIENPSIDQVLDISSI